MVSFASGALIAAGSLPATAAEPAASPQSAPSTNQLAEAKVAVAQWALVKPAVSTDSDGTVRFDRREAISLGGNADIVNQFAAGIEAGGGTVVGGAANPRKVAQVRALGMKAASACRGKNNSTTQWFGWQLKVDSCVANRLIGELAAGAGAATVIGLISSWTGIGGLAAGLVAGILAIGAGVLGACASNGKGLIIDVAWNGVPWCAGQ